jgi:hypothetical protein
VRCRGGRCSTCKRKRRRGGGRKRGGGGGGGGDAEGGANTSADGSAVAADVDWAARDEMGSGKGERTHPLLQDASLKLLRDELG